MKTLLRIAAALVGIVTASAQPTTPINNARFGGTNLVLSTGNLGLLASTSGTLTLGVPATVTSYTFKFPANAGTSGYVLQTDGTGATAWVSAGSAGLPPQSGHAGQFLTTDGSNASWAAVSGTGTVTSVAQTFTGGLISVAGSPITTSGTLALTVAGTSGGIPYFSSGSTWASSSALGAGNLLLGGGAGSAPTSLTAGATTTILVGGGAATAPVWTTATGSGSPVRGTSPAFTTNFTLANSATPSTTAVAETAFDTNAWATGRGAVQVYDGTANTYLVGVLASDTPTNGQVPKWNTNGTITWEDAAAGSVTSVAVTGANGIGVSGSPITSSGTIALSLGAITPTSVASSGAVSGTTGTFSSLTSGRVPFVSTSGLLIDSASLTFTDSSGGLSVSGVYSSGPRITARNTNNTAATTTSIIAENYGLGSAAYVTTNIRGTLASPLPNNASDILGRWESWGYASGGGVQMGRIEVALSAAWTESDRETDIKFYTTDGTTQAVTFTMDHTGNATATGAMQGTRLISTVATGTAPLTVSSTTRVSNLNVATAGTADTLTTARAIYGNNFDGSAALTQIIASTYGGTGNGFTAFTGPTTSEKTFTLPNASATILTSNAAVTVAQGGTGITSGTSGGVPYFSSTSAIASSAALAANAIVLGGGAGAAPATTTTGTGVVTIIGQTANTAGGMVSGNGTVTLSNKEIQQTAAHGTDDTFTGTTILGLNAGATIAQWEVVYLNSSSQWVLADANGSGTYPAVAIAITSGTSGNALTVLTQGTVRNDAWNWTPGGRLYLSTTAGGLTQTAPSTSGDKVQDVGVALTADIAFFVINGVYLTVQ